MLLLERASKLYCETDLQISFVEHTKSLLVTEARGNHPISRYSANQIAPFQPSDTKLAVWIEFLNAITKIEMAAKSHNNYVDLY